MTAASEFGDPAIIHVGLGARAYDIVIGRATLADLGHRIAALRGQVTVAVVADATVASYHLGAAEAALAAAGLPSTRVLVEPGEAAKNWSELIRVCESLLGARIERGDLVLALGGGVIGDLAGFVAGIVRRGLDVVQVPTTLLAQVDSSVGGKTGINSKHGKNLVGLFHQPRLVVADTGLLDTLPARVFRAGYAEVVKYGLLGDAAFYAWLEANWRDIFAGGPGREYAVITSCRAKAAVVAKDERESGLRALLNLGHTFGHALEAATGFSDRLLHGEAVAVGMTLAFAYSARLKLVADEDVKRVAAHLAAVGLPTHLSDIPGSLPGAAGLMELMAQDKKVRRGRLTFILVRGIGESFVASDIDPADVKAFLAEKLAER